MRSKIVAVRMSIGVLFVLLGAGISPDPALLAQGRAVPVKDALDMYERGDRMVLTGFTSAVSAQRLLSEIEKVAPAWIKAAGKTAAPRRRLIVATFALEGAKAATLGRGAVPLIEWACDKLRPPYGEDVPLPAERIWHQAALAVLESRGSYRDVMAHLWHLNTRFRDEPQALLARAWMKQGEWEAIPAEVEALPRADSFDYRFPNGAIGGAMPLYADTFFSSVDRWWSVYPQPDRPRVPPEFREPLLPPLPPLDLYGSIWTTPDQPRDVGRRVIREYERAAESPAVAAEARLRIGYLLFVDGRGEEALPQLAEVSGLTRDRVLLHLADLFMGWTHQRAGRKLEAENAYRRALRVVPSSQTTSLWLAMLLQEQGRLTEAQDLMDTSLAASPKEPDPWPLFGQGSFRHWPALIDRLRGDLWTVTQPARSY
jgi:tetratricopeptide (TPR) repeat protein